MCGIAGFCFTESSCINARHLGRALLEAIEERGREASGFAAFDAEGVIQSNNSPIKASDFVKSKREFSLDAAARTAIFHTRLATKGTISNPLNNHPVHAWNAEGKQISAVHNGSVWNDDESFTKFGLTRYGQVDSEAIPAMLAAYGSADFASIFNELEGGIATGWLDESAPHRLHALRAWDSPMVVASIDTVDKLGFALKGVIFASTVKALTKGLEALGLAWTDEGVDQYEIGEGEFLSVDAGEWDGMVYPFALPDVLSRWGSGWRSKNKATQVTHDDDEYSDWDAMTGGYGYGYGRSQFAGGYGQASRNVGTLSGEKVTGIGSGKVESGKPSTYMSDGRGGVSLVKDDGTTLTPMVLDDSLNSETLDAAEQAKRDEYVAWWAGQSRHDRMADLADLMRHDGYVPTEADINMMVWATDIEKAAMGFDLAQWKAWDEDYTWHMLACKEGKCWSQNPICPVGLDYDDEAALREAAAEWGINLIGAGA
jgi:hypothetical protein